MKSKSVKKNNLTVAFPINYLKQINGKKIVRPQNTNTTWEYYLLENLCATLVKDSITSNSGFDGVLAKNWNQINSKTWKFYLKDQLKWSNGTDLTGQQIKSSFESLKIKGSRHSVYFKKINKINYNKLEHSLSFEFREKINFNFLHELSLADSSIVSRQNLKGDWSVTSGPFFLIEKDKQVILSKNKNFENIFESKNRYADEVFLIDYFEDAEISRLLKKNENFIFPVQSFSLRQQFLEYKKLSKQVYCGEKNVIYFFEFLKLNSISKSINLRNEIRQILQDSFQKALMNNDEINYFEQLIPKGFKGHIDSYKYKKIKNKAKIKRTIQIEMPTLMRGIPDLEKHISEHSKMSNLNVKIKYQDAYPEFDKKSLMRINMFKGNQSDQLASWNFLFSKNIGPLHLFADKVSGLFKKITNSRDKNKVLLRLHKQVLNNVMSVPVFIEANCIYSGSELDFHKINPFDMRLRFYDVQFK